MHALKPKGARPHAGGVLVIHLEGEFDLAERERLMDAFSLADGLQWVVVNLEKATYIDSTVMQCLVGLQLATEKQGARLVLVGVRPPILRLLGIVSLDRVFDIRERWNGTPMNGDAVQSIAIQSRTLAFTE